MNMFAKNSARTVKEYIENVPADRRDTIESLHEFIQQAAPKLKPHYATNMLGYGSMKYLDSRKKPIDWPIISLANQKNYISLYVCVLDGGKWAAEKYASKLGNVSVGKSCIRIKKLEDINLDQLKEVIKLGETSPGMVGATVVEDK